MRTENDVLQNVLNVAVRDLLNQMIRWHLFLREGHPIDMGILDCNMERLLEEDLFLLYKKHIRSLIMRGSGRHLMRQQNCGIFWEMMLRHNAVIRIRLIRKKHVETYKKYLVMV